MLIGIISSPCAGKALVADYLIQHLNCTLIPAHENVSTFVLEELRWKDNWVFFPSPETCEEYMKRPFFLLIFLDAPLSLRYARFQQKTMSDTSLTTFVERNDSVMFNPSMLDILHHADLKLINGYTNKSDLHSYLGRCDLLNPERCRPTWDMYFMKLCNWSARRSNCKYKSNR